MKLGWYRNEKSWTDNIKSRRIVQRNGEKLVVYKAPNGSERPMPIPPKEIWDKPKHLR